MIYVMADIHGMYQKYKKMLEIIHFSDQDVLYVLGDVVDRGPQPMKVLLDMMYRPNAIALIGNHDYMALSLLSFFNDELREENLREFEREKGYLWGDWILNGGDTTCTEFQNLSVEDKTAVLEYLGEFLPFEIVTCNQKRFILVHAGLQNYHKDKKLEDYTLEELIFDRPTNDSITFADDHTYLIVGHTPTLSFKKEAKILHRGQTIYIDCGACYEKEGGKLACICLDTMEEFYV